MIGILLILTAAFEGGLSAPQKTVTAFTAEVSADTDFYQNNVVIFDRVITNERGLYVSSSGQFACVDDDVYVFFWTFCKATSSAHSSGRAIGQLERAGQPVRYGPKTSYYSTSLGGQSEMVGIVQCSNPSAVSVNIVPWSESNLSIRLAALYSSFSGFKLSSSESATVVAFSAKMAQQSSFFPGVTLVFDMVSVNYGNSYYPGYGAFVCPDNGVYVFVVTTETPIVQGWTVSQLKMSNDLLTRGPITYRATSSYDSGSSSTTTVVQCIQGRDVYVEADYSHSYNYNVYGADLTTFTGFRLESGRNYAFTAVLSANFTTEGNQQPLRFDKEVTNIGGWYDPNYSRFICPDNDLYVFSVTAASVESVIYGIYFDSRIIKSGITSFQSSSDSTGTSGSCSSSVTYPCEAGKHVEVRDDSTSLGRIYLLEFTSFSAYKVPGQ